MHKGKNNALIIRLIVTVFALFSMLAIAQDSDELTQLQKLIEQKQFEEAFALSNTLLEEWGGDPEFDLLSGRAAYGTGRFQEAVFAFERVLIISPDVLLARLYLAFSYFQVKNLGAAQTELTKLLSEPLSAEDETQVRDYLAKITALKESQVVKHDFSMRLAYAYDSNANSGTTLDNLSNIPIESPFFQIIGSLDESSLEQRDNSSDLGLNYSYSRKLTQKSGFSLNAGYVQTNFNEQKQLDREILSISSAYSDEFYGSRMNASVYIQPMILDGEFFRAAYGVAVDATWPIHDKWYWMLGLSYASVNVNANDDQDLNQYAARTRFTYQGENIHIFELSYGNDESKLDNVVSISNGKDFWMLNYTFAKPIGNKWLLIANTSYQDIKHDGTNPAIGVLRDETSFNALFNVDYLLNENWKISSALSYTDKDSNVEIYSYDRTTANISVTRSF